MKSKHKQGRRLPWLPVMGMSVLAGLAVLSLGFGLGATPAAATDSDSDSWGPTDRATFTWASPASYVTFNSITDNPTIGDERNFVRVREAGTGTYGDTVELEVGKTYEVYIYVHNNASASLNSSGEGVAENVTLSTDLPTRVESGQSAIVKATISASNATPTSVWDTAYLVNNTGNIIYLRYVQDSAVITNSGTASGSILDADSLFSENGAFLAFSDSYWGIIPGCNDYAGYVTYQVVADSPGFSATKEVSIAGENSFSDVVTTSPGTTLDFTITYTNSGTTEQTYVTVYDALPDGLTYVSGSVVVTRSDGTVVELEDGDALFGESGIVIGDYAGGESTTITYQAVLADEDSFDCGDSTLYNQSTVATANGEITDKTQITVNRTCEETPTSIPDTGPAQIALLVVVVAAIGGGTAYYIHTRKALKAAKATASGSPLSGLNGSASGTTGASNAFGAGAGTSTTSPTGTGVTPANSTNNLNNSHNASSLHAQGNITGLSSENFGQNPDTDTSGDQNQSSAI